MGKKTMVRVKAPGLYRANQDGATYRCPIGERFEVTLSNKGEIPMVYRGKVELDERPALMTDKAAGPDTSADADEQRRQHLMDEIEKMSGKRPGGNTKLETLEEKFAELKTAQE